MPRIHQISYTSLIGDERRVELSQLSSPDAGVHFSFLTGQNGSDKSTILSHLVASQILPGEAATSEHDPRFPSKLNSRIICFSGSTADRFPLKERVGTRTGFDVPSYVYIGQMVGPNLLSKKAPMETMIQHALDPAVKDRYFWPFFKRAFEFAGIRPELEFRLRSWRNVSQQQGSDTVYNDVVRSISPASSDRRHHNLVSPATAAFLLDEFDRATFDALESYLTTRRNRGAVVLTEEGVRANELTSTEFLRLGLMTGLLVLSRCDVQSNRTSTKFSAFDLSSGEYHILTALLSVGFSLTKDALVLVDEPENSLHPQWQQDFMSTLIEMAEYVEEGHVIVATHSPLIVSAAPEKSTIVDLTPKAEFTFADEVRLGGTADDVLFERFGLASSRNRKVAATIQQAISLVENGLDRTAAFETLRPDLQYIRSIIPDDDPFVEILEALLDERTGS